MQQREVVRKEFKMIDEGGILEQFVVVDLQHLYIAVLHAEHLQLVVPSPEFAHAYSWKISN